jgi:hypothetical protein
MCIFIVVNTYTYISIKNRAVTGQENQKKDAFDLCPSTVLRKHCSNRVLALFSERAADHGGAR